MYKTNINNRRDIKIISISDAVRFDNHGLIWLCPKYILNDWAKIILIHLQTKYCLLILRTISTTPNTLPYSPLYNGGIKSGNYISQTP